MNYIQKLAALFSLVGIIGCQSNDKNAAPQTAAPPPILEYSVLVLTPRSTTLFSDYPATIQGQQNIEIRPKIDGYIDAIYVDEGAIVSKGQTLFRISAPQYEQEVRTAQANIKIAEADVQAAQMEVSKVSPLVEKNIISKYELESRQYILQAKQATLAQAQARLVNAKTNLGYTTIASPVNGVIGAIPFKMGSLVSSNMAQALTTVSDIKNIHAYFSINEKQALQFMRNTPGTTPKERLSSMPPVTLLLADGVEFPKKGKLEQGSGIINTQIGSFSVRANFPNTNNMIRSGSTGTVRIPQTIDSVLIIPQKATYELQGKYFVYVLDSADTARSTEISIMENNDGSNYVVESGLHEGEKIIIEGVATLKNGTAIKPRMVNADSVYQKIF